MGLGLGYSGYRMIDIKIELEDPVKPFEDWSFFNKDEPVYEPFYYFKKFYYKLKVKMEEHEGWTWAYYNAVTDKIAVSHYAPLVQTELIHFHELVHWTGHISRLNRFNKNLQLYYSRNFNEEEAIAEIGSKILCKEYGISFNRDSHIDTYLSNAQTSDKIIIRNAKQAVDFIQNKVK